MKWQGKGDCQWQKPCANSLLKTLFSLYIHPRISCGWYTLIASALGQINYDQVKLWPVLRSVRSLENTDTGIFPSTSHGLQNETPKASQFMILHHQDSEGSAFRQSDYTLLFLDLREELLWTVRRWPNYASAACQVILQSSAIRFSCMGNRRISFIQVDIQKKKISAIEKHLFA